MIPASLKLTPSAGLVATYDLITAALGLPEEAIVAAGSSPGAMRARLHYITEEITSRYTFGTCPVIRGWVHEQWFGADGDWEREVMAPLLGSSLDSSE